MQKFKLNEMTRGWFVGDFEPSVLKSSMAEFGVKHYKKGDYEERHYHKIATEITLIIKGRVQMNETIYEANDIVLINPKEDTDFKALEDTITAVVKIPSVKNDKFKGVYK